MGDLGLGVANSEGELPSGKEMTRCFPNETCRECFGRFRVGVLGVSVSDEDPSDAVESKLRR